MDEPTAKGRRGPRPGTPEARHGGSAVLQKYGPDFYREIGRKGGNAIKREKGHDFFTQIGKKGGNATLRNQGTEHFRRIGAIGGASASGVTKPTPLGDDA